MFASLYCYLSSHLQSKMGGLLCALGSGLLGSGCATSALGVYDIKNSISCNSVVDRKSREVFVRVTIEDLSGSRSQVSVGSPSAPDDTSMFLLAVYAEGKPVRLKALGYQNNVAAEAWSGLSGQLFDGNAFCIASLQPYGSYTSTFKLSKLVDLKANTHYDVVIKRDFTDVKGCHILYGAHTSFDI